MNPSPKVITGPLHPDNKGACDWGYQGFLAYGCYGFIVVVDTKTLQVIQTAGPQKGNITHVRWIREKYHHAFATGSTYSLILAAADTTGSIIVWDMVTGQMRTGFSENQSGNKITCMEWLPGHDDSHDLLVVLRGPDLLEMWDAYSGIRLWKSSVGESGRSLTLDPFNMHRLVVLCDSPRLLVLSDISPTHEPSDNITYIQFTDPSPVAGGKRKSSSSSDRLLLRTSHSWSKVASLASNILSSQDQANKRQSVTDDDTDLVTSCLQAVFNPAHRHFLLLLFPTELQMLDIDVELVLGVIRLDRSSPNFIKVIPCQCADMMLCLHENGSASVRVRRQTEKKQQSESAIIPMDMTYELRCQSDALRLLRQSKVFGFVYQPVTERQACIILSDSRVIVLDVMKTEYFKDMEGIQKALPAFSLSDLVQGQTVTPPTSHLKRKVGEITLKFVTSGLVSGVVAPVTMAAMARSAANLHEAGTVIAVGSGAGTIQLVNVYSGQVEREYKLFMSPVRYLEWLDATRLVAYSFPDPPSYGNRNVKSEVVLLNIKSGCITVLRMSKGKEGPILLMRISPSRKFFALVVQDKPLEFWKIDTKQLIREVPLHVNSKPLDLSWYPYVHVTTKKVSTLDSNGEAVETEKRYVCEQLFMLAQTDMGNIIKFAVLDGYLTDKKYFSNEVIFGYPGVRSDFYLMVWKKRYAIIADKLGPLYMTDGKNKMKTKKFCDTHGGVAIRVRFAPGADNMRFFVLYPDALTIWNIIHEKVELEASSPSVGSVIVDAVWAGPESVVLVTEDSSLHVMTLRHKKPTSPSAEEDDFYHVSGAALVTIPSHMLSWKLSDVFSPAILEPRTAFLLKYSLQCNIEPFNTKLSTLVPPGSRRDYKFIKDKGTSMADRCYMVARLFGDEYDIDFWRLFKYKAVKGKADRVTLTSSVTEPLDLLQWFSKNVFAERDGGALVDLSGGDLDPEGQGEGEGEDMDMSWIRDLEGESAPCTAGLDVLMSSEEYKACELSRLALCNKRRYDYRVKQLVTGRWIQLGKADMAVQGLMETEIDNTNFRSDYLKACLTSCIQTTSTSLSMIKLAATHLIAGGHVNDGVELLCLINKRLDASKYLISSGQWKNALWLAKTSLPERECLDIVCKFAEHLWQTKQKSAAVLLMLSVDQYMTVLRMLCELRMYDTAAVFLQACQEQGLITSSQHTDCVYLEFAKLLAMTEYQSAAAHYCHLAGQAGTELLADLTKKPKLHL